MSFDLAAIPIRSLTLGVALLQWLIVMTVFLALAAREKNPKKTRSRKSLVISACLLLGAWLYAFDVGALFANSRGDQGAPVTSQRVYSCASVRVGMSAADVDTLLGKPDEKAAEEDTRGPGSEVWTYRNPTCSVHLWDNVVEFID